MTNHSPAIHERYADYRKARNAVRSEMSELNDRMREISAVVHHFDDEDLADLVTILNSTAAKLDAIESELFELVEDREGDDEK